MGLIAKVREKLISNEMGDGVGTELRTDRQGSLWVTGTVTVDTSALATQVTLAAAKADLDAILAKIIAAPATEATLAAIKADLDTISGAVATAAKQDTGNTTLSTISTSLSSLVSANHTDLTQLHTDISTGVHADLAAILAKQPAAPSLDVPTAATTVATPTPVSILITAIQLAASPTTYTKGLLLVAPAANAETVYVGGSGVTAANGIPIEPKGSLELPRVQNLGLLYGITAGGGTCYLRAMGLS